MWRVRQSRAGVENTGIVICSLVDGKGAVLPRVEWKVSACVWRVGVVCAPRAHIDGEVWHLDVGSYIPGLKNPRCSSSIKGGTRAGFRMLRWKLRVSGSLSVAGRWGKFALWPGRCIYEEDRGWTDRWCTGCLMPIVRMLRVLRAGSESDRSVWKASKCENSPQDETSK